MNSEIYFIRHAESEFNLKYAHLIGGRSNFTPLTPKGIQQAVKLGQYLLRENIFPTHVYSSPAVRTLETARLSLAEMGVEVEVQIYDELQEMGHGSFEGLVRADVFTEELRAQRQKEGKAFKLPDPNAESMDDAGLRKLLWLNTVPQPEPDTRHFVYGHGMAIRSMLSHALDWTHIQTYEAVTGNTSITKLTYEEGWVLKDEADFARLPE